MKKQTIKSLVALSLIATVAIGSTTQAFALSTTKMPNMKTTTKQTAKAPAAAKEQEYTGYLVDANCGVRGTDDMKKVNLKKSPEKHTTECLKMEMCMKSGLGLSLKQKDGTYKYYKFDEKGSKLADDKIMMMTKRKFGHKVTVKGTIKDSTLTISSIKEVK